MIRSGGRGLSNQRRSASAWAALAADAFSQVFRTWCLRNASVSAFFKMPRRDAVRGGSFGGRYRCARNALRFGVALGPAGRAFGVIFILYRANECDCEGRAPCANANAVGNITFAWDRRKARSNLAKHGVTFEEAQTVFWMRVAG